MYAYSYKVNIAYYYRDSLYLEDYEKSSIFFTGVFLDHKALKVTYP